MDHRREHIRRTRGGGHSHRREFQGTDPSPGFALTTCVVAGKPLPALSKRAAVVYGGTDVQFCCAPCIDRLHRAPARWVARVREAQQ